MFRSRTSPPSDFRGGHDNDDFAVSVSVCVGGWVGVGGSVSWCLSACLFVRPVSVSLCVCVDHLHRCKTSFVWLMVLFCVY